MFDIGLQEMLVICVLALLVFGPSKLPELGRMFGRAMREFRRASDEFRSTVETNLNIHDAEPPSAPPEPLEVAAAAVAALPAHTDGVSAEPESGVAVATEAAPAPPEPFCAQRGSRIFHRSDCAWALRIAEYERRYLRSVAEARAEGLLTCPVCEPWEPA